MTMEGWIQVSRKLLDWEYFNDELMLRGWLYLLLKANHEDKVWRGLEIKRGQYVTSLSKMARDLGISVQQTRRILNTLKSTYEIASCATNKFTIISICKYDIYQGDKKKRQQALQQASQQALQQQLNKINNKKNTPSNEGASDSPSDPPSKEVNIDFGGLLSFWNKTMETSNAVIPKLKSMTERRKGLVRARVREHDKRAVFEVITKAAASDFLNGKNQRGWVASFDWIMLPTNFQKVLEDNYDNRNNHYQNNGTNNNRQSAATGTNADGREERARAYAATIARLAAEDEARQGTVRRQDDVPY